MHALVLTKLTTWTVIFTGLQVVETQELEKKRRQLTEEEKDEVYVATKFLVDVTEPATKRSIIETEVGWGTQKVKTRDLVTGKTYNIRISCGGTVHYSPGVELSVSIVGMFQSSNFYLGYGASRDAYFFEYYGASKGFETELASMTGQVFSLQYVNKFAEFHGLGKEFCLGGDLPGDFAGIDLCWSWAEGESLNTFGFGLSAGIGMSPFSIGETTCKTFIHAVSCL